MTGDNSRRAARAAQSRRFAERIPTPSITNFFAAAAPPQAPVPVPVPVPAPAAAPAPPKKRPLEEISGNISSGRAPKTVKVEPLSRDELRALLQERLDELAPGMTLGELMKDEENEDHEVVTEERWLNRVWAKPPGTSARGTGGRPEKSGQDQIKDAAATCRQDARRQPNPTAEALGLGPCEIAKADGRRPRHGGIRAVFDGKPGRKATMTYHLTWVAVYGLIPSRELEYSHRCHEACCINPGHGCWESRADNKSRDCCREEDAPPCPHQPPCLI
ncbi:hypothetical protein MMC11_008931 [Xylographa trunciseda]|nr:hypothetical protein [Xylographa trunciseda]